MCWSYQSNWDFSRESFFGNCLFSEKLIFFFLFNRNNVYEYETENLFIIWKMGQLYNWLKFKQKLIEIHLKSKEK